MDPGLADGDGETPNRIQVVVRVRPVLPHELSDEVAVTCSPDARKLQVLLPERLGGAALPGASRSGARSYEFDACLSGQTTQEDLFDICGMQELVEAALDGYCVTIFAFGQTGSGKTHTIIGPRLSRGAAGASSTPPVPRAGSFTGADSDGYALPTPASAGSDRNRSSATGASPGALLVDTEDGVLTRAISAAYRSIEARAGSAEFTVSASCLELYNEAVTDLLGLDKSKTLQVRKDERDGFGVVGLTQVACPTDAAAVRFMVRALQHRHTRGHRLNEYSSRSHCLMTFVFASKETGPEGQMGARGGIRRYGKLVLVDLAGSERLKETGNTEKAALRETGAINKSLFTLGQVLGALSARSTGGPGAAGTFVPYRDSKLTQLLWDGLRGSGRCLMLACLGPMRGAAEESLNTLHFATMATRIKAEPVILLDPQDQLVMDLRKTITELRQENRQLASALQQLSTGTDPSCVLASLPDGLRAHAANTQHPGTAGSDTAGSDDVSTPPRVHQLQPLPGGRPWVGSGRPQLVSDLGDGASGASTPASLDGAGGGYGANSLMLQSIRSAQSVTSPVPVGRAPRTLPPPRTGGSGNGGGGSRPAALKVPSPSPSRAPVFAPERSRAPGSGGKPPPAASSPKRDPGRAKSVGRGGGGASASNRPAHLTEDPGALLYGLSTALGTPTAAGGGPLPPVQQRRSGPERATTLPAVGPTPPPALTEFPELAAMEAEFQRMMAGGGGGGGASVSVLRAAGGGAGPPLQAAANAAAAAAAAAAAEAARRGAWESGSDTGEADDGGLRPDVRALKWAERNTWFGADYDMTAFAYQIHDRLVEVEHMDPTSDLYYMEIERRVAERFPDRWARAMRDQLPGGSGAAAAAAVRRAAPSPPKPPAPHYGAGLRVNLKEPLAVGGGGAVMTSAAPPRPSPQPRGAAQYDNGAYGGGAGTSYDYGDLQLSMSSLGPSTPMAGGPPPLPPAASYPSSSGSAPSTPSMYGNAPPGAGPNPQSMGPINPFNIGALHAVAPPKASRFAPHDAFSDPNAAERIQREYARQRAAVVDELRKAKAEAEAERQRILARIQRAAGGNKWRG